ncbi:MAG: NADH-quinone oxidoreductase subunit N, partial [Gammaproteobacteria bacterium]|nr:NADH-quinone oxidoreductase subunit N [Gammaproteobacteria bacterium]
MQFEMPSLIPVLPELFLLTMTCVILVVDLFLKEEQRVISYGLTQVTLLLAVCIVYLTSGSEAEVIFYGSVIRDPMGDVLKIAIYLISAGAFLYSKDYLLDRNLFKGEFYVLGLFAVLGMTVMVSANSFLTVYLGLELLALSLYTLVAFDRDSKAGSEAAMKYFVLGALASGMLLYGISMIYGATGSVEFQPVAEAVAEMGMDNMVLVFGLVFVVIGLAFKFGAVPMHMWVPDVYHGAPTAVTLFIGSTPKIA